MKSKKINLNKSKEFKKTKKTKQKEGEEKEEKETEEAEEKEEKEIKKEERKKGEKAAVLEPVFDFQLQTVTEPAPVIPVPKKKEEAKAKEFNLEGFLQGVDFKDEKDKEKKYVSKQDYSIAKYVQDQGVERKYTNTAREWREAMVAKGEHVKELFPKPSRRARLREEALEPSAKEMETIIGTQERLEYEYKVPFEEKIETRKEKRIKKYEIIK